VLIGRPDGVPLLRAGVKLTGRYLELLERAGVSAIYVEDAESAGIVVEPVVDDATRQVATRAVAGAYRSAQDSIKSGRPLDPAAAASLEDIVQRIMRQIESSGGIALALADLSSADAYTFQHSIDVTAVGLLIGQRYLRKYGWVDYRGERHYNKIDERLSTLGLGLLLHDIGKLAVPLNILNKPEKLTPDEWKLMRSHPRFGVDMLEGNQWSPLVKAVVLRHHERWDGSGYPGNKVGEEIHVMARIAAVADVYDAITSDRVYAKAQPAHDAVRMILDGAGTQFDPDVVDAFRHVVAPYPPGAPIELADGRHGIVVRVPEGALDRPVVRLLDGPGAPCEVSLLLDSSLRIAGWDRAPESTAAAA
jgi:HD-GYP domain-containing protein (c-di-GMP phosphodiesterase class II)